GAGGEGGMILLFDQLVHVGPIAFLADHFQHVLSGGKTGNIDLDIAPVADGSVALHEFSVHVEDLDPGNGSTLDHHPIGGRIRENIDRHFQVLIRYRGDDDLVLMESLIDYDTVGHGAGDRLTHGL